MKIRIERFKSIVDVEIDLAKATLLVGGNNSGKSSILQAIQFGVSVAQTASLQGGYWSNNRLSTSIGQSELLYSPLKDVMSLAYNGRLREDENEAIKISYIDGQDECKITVKKGRNKNIVLSMMGEKLGRDLQSISSPFSSLVTGLAGIPAEEEYETPYVVKKAYARGDSNSVFRNILLMLKSNSTAWDKFIRYISALFDGLRIDVDFNPETYDAIDCTVTTNGLRLPVDSCGTGVLQAIQIFAYTCLFNPRLLILDEPDSHLHPNNQKKISGQLLEIADSGVSIVISTHSKNVIESLIDDAKLIWISKGKIVPPVDHYEIRSLIEIGALNEGERISSANYVILTEDKSKELIEILIEANGITLDDCDILSYSGCTNLNTAIILIKYLRKNNPDATYIVHRDRDFMDESSVRGYVDTMADHRAMAFIPDKNDLESYFTTSEHIADSLGISIDEAKAIRGIVITKRKSQINEKYVNTRIENDKRLGQKINAGAISSEFNSKFDREQDRESVLHGKILLRGIRDVLRERNIEDRLLSITPSLVIPALKRQLASAIPQSATELTPVPPEKTEPDTSGVK